MCIRDSSVARPVVDSSPWREGDRAKQTVGNLQGPNSDRCRAEPGDPWKPMLGCAPAPAPDMAGAQPSIGFHGSPGSAQKRSDLGPCRFPTVCFALSPSRHGDESTTGRATERSVAPQHARTAEADEGPHRPAPRPPLLLRVLRRVGIVPVGVLLADRAVHVLDGVLDAVTLGGVPALRGLLGLCATDRKRAVSSLAAALPVAAFVVGFNTRLTHELFSLECHTVVWTGWLRLPSSTAWGTRRRYPSGVTSRGQGARWVSTAIGSDDANPQGGSRLGQPNTPSAPHPASHPARQASSRTAPTAARTTSANAPSRWSSGTGRKIVRGPAPRPRVSRAIDIRSPRSS